ncbi:hypothetical protein L9F63_017408, partial [Diploptera punctata]
EVMVFEPSSESGFNPGRSRWSSFRKGNKKIQLHVNKNVFNILIPKRYLRKIVLFVCYIRMNCTSKPSSYTLDEQGFLPKLE